MSPVLKPKGQPPSIPPRLLVIIICAFCLMLVVLTFHSDSSSSFFRNVFGPVLMPFENGIAKAGSWMCDRAEEFKSVQELKEENESLREEVDRLTIENTSLQQDRYELASLRSLYELDGEYQDYVKTGARVISKDSKNWYSSFLINKGSKDGIELDMNVMAGSGLVGRIDAVGPDWARVLSIISDNSNVSAMVLSTQSNIIVSGSLEDYARGVIGFGQLMDQNRKVAPGDKIVTSQISEKYLPGILVGYVDTVQDDANNLTRSGTLTPAVDFSHLGEVLVVTQVKKLPDEPYAEE